MKNKTIHIHQLGKMPYQDAWEFQDDIFKKIVSQKSLNRKEDQKDKHDITQNHLLFVEHPAVYTIGKSGIPEHLLVSEESLNKEGISFVKTNRGGDITFHGLGQLVGYPILDLDHFFSDIHKYLRLLEESVILTLADYGIIAGRSQGETGVWIDAKTANARKICAMGVRASRWVTMHGFALNINTDLSYFDKIIPCGIRNKAVTSIEQELGYKVALKSVQDKLLKHFQELFKVTKLIYV